MNPMDIDHDSETPGKKGVKDSQKLSFGDLFRVEKVGLAVFWWVFCADQWITNQEGIFLKELDHHIKQGYPKKTRSESHKLWV